MLKKNPKIFCGALYRIATATFLGIWTLNLTNLFRNKDTKCHKRYHPGKKPIRIFTRDIYLRHYQAGTVTLYNLRIFVISQAAAAAHREWQRQQPLVVSCPRALTLCNSIILYVNSFAFVTHPLLLQSTKKHSSVEANYFYKIVINNSLKNWCAQLTRLWLSILILCEWAVNDLTDMRQQAEGRW